MENHLWVGENMERTEHGNQIMHKTKIDNLGVSHWPSSYKPVDMASCYGFIESLKLLLGELERMRQFVPFLNVLPLW